LNEDSQKIKELVGDRNISRLCHFTQSRKLSHILSNPRGILSTKELLKVAPDLVDITDPERLDGHPDYICCSIEFPNSWYLVKAKSRDPLFKEWVILFLDPSILWRYNVLFCPRNAAAEHGSLIRGGYDGFKSIFADEVSGAGGIKRKRTAGMLNCCPTDDQAEVMVEKEITRDNIIAIAVASVEQARLEKTRLSLIKDVIMVPWIIAPELFNSEWSKAVRVGKRLEEKGVI
jgi:hypothetical protein